MTTAVLHTPLHKIAGAKCRSIGQVSYRPLSISYISSRRLLTKSGRWKIRAEEEKKGLDVKEPLLENKLPIEKPLPGEGRRDPAKEDKSLAVVTGAVSILIGVAYLAAVTFLNARGNDLQPPPPEAFGL